MVEYIIKRDGRKVHFELDKITDAIIRHLLQVHREITLNMQRQLHSRL